MSAESFAVYVNGLPVAVSLGPTDKLYVQQAGVSKQILGSAFASGGGGATSLSGDVTGSISGTNIPTTIAASVVTNAKLANMPASTIKGNTTGGSATPTDFTIDGLTLKATPAAGDELIIWDVAGAAIKKATVSSVGGGTPGGSTLQIQYNNASAFAGMSGTSWDDTNRSLALTGATVTTSHPVLDLSQTWNAGGVVFDGIKLNITNTASADNSKWFDGQFGGATKAAIMTNAGGFGIFFNGTSTNLSGMSVNSSDQILFGFTGNTYFLVQNGGTILASSYVYGWSPSGNPTNGIDTGTSRIAAGVVAVGNGTGGDHTGFLQWGGQGRVTSDFNTGNTTTLANITGLSVTVAAGRTYTFEADLYTTSNVAAGVKFAIAGTATATSIVYEAIVNDPAPAAAQTRAAALATTVGAITAVTAAKARITGTITVNAGGTLTVQMAQNVGNAAGSVALRGSSLLVWDMP